MFNQHIVILYVPYSDSVTRWHMFRRKIETYWHIDIFFNNQQVETQQSDTLGFYQPVLREDDLHAQSREEMEMET